MPLLGPNMESRNQAFQALKPQCVALSQAALTANGQARSFSTIIELLERLKGTVFKLSVPGLLDAKLADYIFFPLSQVLKLSNRLTIRCLELSLQCLAALVAHGWRQNIEPQLAAQIVILCTLMAERKPKGFAFDESTDELQAASLHCLHHVFDAAGRSPSCQASFVSEANFPQLGQTITVVLKGISDAPSLEPQLAATEALEALTDGVMTKEACTSFLPGLVGNLTKVLTPTTKQRRNHQVLIGCMNIFTNLVRKTLSDESTSGKRLESSKTTEFVASKGWEETAAKKLEPALRSIMCLQSHPRDDVTGALAKLCLTLLEYCRKSLADCSAPAIEALLSLSLPEDQSSVRMELERLVGADSTLCEQLQTVVYDKLRSLPTAMQSSDEQLKMRRIEQVQAAYELLNDIGADNSILDKVLASALRDSVVITLQASRKSSDVISTHSSSVQSMDLTNLDGNRWSTEYGQSMVTYKGQAGVLDRIESFVRIVSKSAASSALVADTSRSLRLSEGDTQLADFWLLLIVKQSATQVSDVVTDFLDLGDHDASPPTEALEEIYAFALSVLNSTSNDDASPDARMCSLALRTVALRAQHAGKDFRYELIDALYPVLHSLATPEDVLQRDSTTTLTIIAQACEYSSVRELIVENVDYLTNSVALKLNAFDISPQAPQVLLMMVSLAGPSLLPFLEDTIDSIFAVLESYHGYGLLVELLFRVLAVVAEEGAKAPALVEGAKKALAAAGFAEEDALRPISIANVAELLKEKAMEEMKTNAYGSSVGEGHPKRPWKDPEQSDDGTRDGEQDEEDAQDQQIDDADVPPPAPKTYQILFKITELTQHFLPSASPSLRTNLLSLTRTTVPAIARHENSFLPLINTLWPEIVSRLEDEEMHVQAAALDTVAVLCEHAGNFMRSRIVRLWPLLLEMHARLVKEILFTGYGAGKAGYKEQETHKPGAVALVSHNNGLHNAVARLESSPVDYTNTNLRLLWTALVSTITASVRYVAPSPDNFDEALDMLAPVLEQEDIRQALEKENADAVWLARIRSGALAHPVVPLVPAGCQWAFAMVAG
ncbi:hypothetical protein LTR78_003906 [Recurvomyces mirabilis]|uniref:TEL2-interacting protein 1 n=1 Tax=Recurvomyces mirabilis TaxID=574656 RepID=A0AAE0WQV6_9PEZI|nr:hypothetical protein LTR78_003906 [Recurvomyces mirabilis]KAK5153955.1 hypothetical protein LTS14_007175 [Recurvomyces mirabilis]